MIILHRSEPDKHIERWYCVALTTDLFGHHALYRAWGSRRTAYQHVRCDAFPTVEEAQHAAQRIIARRLQRGYQPVHDDQDLTPPTQPTPPTAVLAE